MVPDCHNGYASMNILLCSCKLVVVVSCHKLCCCTYCCLPCNSWPNCERSLPAVGPHYSVWVKACTSCWRTCVLFLGAAPCTWWSSAIVLSCCLKRCGVVLHVWCFRGTAMFFLDIVLGEALWLSNELGFLHFWWMKFTVPVFERACSGHASTCIDWLAAWTDVVWHCIRGVVKSQNPSCRDQIIELCLWQ